MNVEVKSSYGITLEPMETKLLANRYIFIEGDITAESACDFVKKIMILINNSRSTPIHVFINSQGGEIDSGLLILDTIQSCKTPIATYCIGRAYSMAALIFAAGTNGRCMLPNSKLMLHEPLIGANIGGSCTSVKSMSDNLIETKDKINNLLSKLTGQTIEDVEKATGYDHFFSAEEAIKFGLCDKIVSITEIMDGVYYG